MVFVRLNHLLNFNKTSFFLADLLNQCNIQRIIQHFIRFKITTEFKPTELEFNFK